MELLNAVKSDLENIKVDSISQRTQMCQNSEIILCDIYEQGNVLYIK